MLTLNEMFRLFAQKFDIKHIKNEGYDQSVIIPRFLVVVISSTYPSHTKFSHMIN